MKKIESISKNDQTFRKGVGMLTFLLGIIFTNSIFAQSMAQDSTLNNLVYPAGYKTCNPGELGSVKKTGHGKKTMILISGLGFGGEVYKDFEKNYQKNYTIYTITPAGFDGTPAPPMPEKGVTYAQLTFTNGIVNGVLDLIDKKKLTKPIIVANFVTGTQVALNLAINYPDKIGKVIIIGGSPYRWYAGQKDGQYNDWVNEIKYTPEQRSRLIELYWAPKWFKTVTKKTWDDNMWTADDYVKDPAIGKAMFDTSAKVPIAVMVRYLIEWMAYDPAAKYKDIKVPVLVLVPDFKEQLTILNISDKASCTSVAAKQYLKYFHQESWQKAKDAHNPLIEMETIPNTRLFMWYDNPNAVYTRISNFLNKRR